DSLGPPPARARGQPAARAREVPRPTAFPAGGPTLTHPPAGRPPFRAETALDTLSLVLAQPPASLRRLRPGVPYDLETVCLKCLHKEPVLRYASADDLRRFLDGKAVRARRAGWAELAWRWCRRHPAALVGT